MNKIFTWLIGYSKLSIVSYLRIGLLLFCAMMTGWGLTVYAQREDGIVQRNQQAITDLGQRISSLEQQRLDSRISTLEAIGKTDTDMLEAVLVCLLGLSADAIYRVVDRKRNLP